MPLAEFDAIIVLANLMDKDGQLNAETRDRLRLGVDLLEQGRAPVLVTCGWAYRSDSDICIADAMQAHAVRQWNVPAEKIIAERNSRDTVGDAYFTRINLAIPGKWKKIAVTTSDYHAPRTADIFRFVYGAACQVEVFGAEAETNEKTIESENNSRAAFEKTFDNVQAGDVDGITRALRENHPFYNGAIYPRI